MVLSSYQNLEDIFAIVWVQWKIVKPQHNNQTGKHLREHTKTRNVQATRENVNIFKADGVFGEQKVNKLNTLKSWNNCNQRSLHLFCVFMLLAWFIITQQWIWESNVFWVCASAFASVSSFFPSCLFQRHLNNSIKCVTACTRHLLH